MKSLLSTLSICAVLAAPATAEINDEALEACSKIGEMASVVMQARQMNFPMSKVMTSVGGDKLLESMVVAAYRQSNYLSAEMQQESIDSFRNSQEGFCFESYLSK